MAVESARQFVERYVTDERFREQVDSADPESGFAHEAGYDFTAEELESAAREVNEGTAEVSGFSADLTSDQPRIDIQTLAPRALYGLPPIGL